jgi:hypothetical protein
VLYNILVQGTEFNNLSDAAVNEKYDELLDVSYPTVYSPPLFFVTVRTMGLGRVG